jgi:hypothetical protein
MLRAQTRPETIRGRITTDSTRPVAGAVVTATMAPSRAFAQSTTDSTGRFAIRFAEGSGDYLMHVTALGYATFRKRLTRAPDDTSLTLDVKLTPVVARLSTVRVQARAVRPERGKAVSGIGASEQQQEGVFAAVAPDQEGQLAALADAVPGTFLTPAGLSVLGLAGEQSTATLNGLAFSGSSLPRDANTRISVATSTYDPARGGFSGAQTTVELGAGSSYLLRKAHLTGDVPLFEAPSELASQVGQRFTTVNGSIGGSGELVDDRWYYNSGLQVSQRSAQTPSLFSLGGAGLNVAGIASDSAARFRQLLSTTGVPLSVASARGSTISQTAAFVTRIDHAPYKPGGWEPASETWNVTIFGNIANDQGQGSSPFMVATRTGEHRALVAGGQFDYSRYFGDVLSDTRTGLTTTANRGRPYLRAPGGIVLVTSALSAGDAAMSELAFGGNGSLDYDQQSWTWEMINETRWNLKGRPHQITLTAESRFDGYLQTTPQNVLGTFTYPSLDALARNEPSSFARTLIAPAQRGGEWSGFVALGNYWHATPSLQVLYGARFEANRFTTPLTENTSVSSAFGATTAHAPNTVHVSPRLGFTWYFGREPSGRGVRVNQVAKQSQWPTMMLRGGIGEFRGLMPATLLTEATAANGLPGGISHLTCIGAAVPTPRWEDYLRDDSAVPTDCADGAPASLIDAAPGVKLFDRSFAAPRSWRANLAWVSTWRNIGLKLEGTYSLNLNQAGTVDLNFAGAPQFVIKEEDNRPVFVSPTAIVPTSGLVSPLEARRSRAFGRVVSTRSDLRSTSRQITATISPRDFGNVFYSLSYTLGGVQATKRGFDGSTFGSPSEIQRAPADLDVRHQLIASVGTALPYGMSLAFYGRFMSGLPYTPRIATDVNGDGLFNDRAFVFAPNRAADPQVATAMQALLTEAPSQARDCLLRQLGTPAAPNSCRGPWSALLNARIGLISRSGFTRRGFTATLHLTNPLGGLDQLLHGSEHLQGWGGVAAPDPTLLSVRAFDPGMLAYRYEVNPRFGSTRATQQLAQVPFRVTLDMSFDLGVPVVKQQALKLLSPGRRGHAGARLSADSTTARLKAQVPDVYDAVMEESDSLLISRDQLGALKAAQGAYRAKIAALWKETSTALTTMGDDFDANEAMNLIDDATERAWRLGRDELPTLEVILSPLQMRLVPWVITSLRQSQGREKIGIRIFRF